MSVKKKKKNVPIHQVDIEMWREVIKKVIRIHNMWTTNVCSKFKGNVV